MDQSDSVKTSTGRSSSLRLWLIIDSVLSALGLIPAAIMGMMSVMASDAGVNTAIYLFIATMMTFPLALVVCPIIAWVLFFLRRERAALIVSLLPLLWVLVGVAILTFGWGTPRPI